MLRLGCFWLSGGIRYIRRKPPAPAFLCCQSWTVEWTMKGRASGSKFIGEGESINSCLCSGQWSNLDEGVQYFTCTEGVSIVGWDIFGGCRCPVHHLARGKAIGAPPNTAAVRRGSKWEALGWKSGSCHAAVAKLESSTSTLRFERTGVFFTRASLPQCAPLNAPRLAPLVHRNKCVWCSCFFILSSFP
ncbi:unnamed protein product [Ectocarpus sp. 12 AP-2014]